MNPSMVVRLLARTLVLACLGAPCLLPAQFQQPTPEDLKLTADPNYPDAAAIYLDYEDKADNNLGYRSEYARIKILKESAKELATVNLGYLKGNGRIEAISGRTIHADGTIIPLTGKPEDLVRVKAGDSEVHEKVFNLPSVEVGSIIEYYYQVRFEGLVTFPTWEIQRRYPVRRAKFFLKPYGLGRALMWYPNLPPGKTIAPDAVGRFELTVTDIPPLVEEKWAPPIESRRYQVIFFYTGAMSEQDFWVRASRDWAKEVDRFAEPTSGLRGSVAALFAPGDSEIDKARKIYAAVQALDNTDFSRKKTKAELKMEKIKTAKRADDIWNQKSGSGEEIALLYLAMLRAAGLTAYPMLVVNRDQGVFSPDNLSFSQFDDTVIILSTGGKEIVLDPAEKMCPFEMVHWIHSGAGGIRENDKGAGPWVTPLLPYTANAITRRADVTVSPDGSVAGKLQFGFTGQDALTWRESLLRSDEDAVKKNMDEWLATQLPTGVSAQVTRFANLDNSTAELTVYATVTGAAGTATSKRLMLPGSFFSDPSERVFIDQPSRQLPVDMHYASVTKDGVLYHLPAGFVLETVPPAASIPWTGNAVFQIKATTNGNALIMNRTMARAFTLMQADQYSQLRDFYQKVATADQQQIVLTASSPQKGE